MRVYKLYMYYIISTMLNTMRCCFNGKLAFYSLRWTSSKITLYMSLNTVSSNDGYGQWPKHVGVHYSRILVQSVGDELVYVYHLHGKCAVLTFKNRASYI
jgi:hypothetical protein